MSQEKFHIHIDGTVLPPTLDKYARTELGFYPTDFQGHPPGFDHFEPNAHRTWKTNDVAQFRSTWKALTRRAQAERFIDYLEGELITRRVMIEPRPSNLSAPFPFQLTRRRLQGPPHESFRQAELHLTFDRDASDPRVALVLLEAGFFGAYIPKASYTALVLTAQGKVEDITRLVPVLENYLREAGGLIHATLKEERAIRYSLHGVTHEHLPEVVDQIVTLV